jgi:murein DD-endopeptidase MepM/ murein hydrolase activator NlpD
MPKEHTPMNTDERLYAFIVAGTSRSRSEVRRFSIHRRWVKVSALAAGMVLFATLYGFYGLAQQAMHIRIEEENDRLRRENELQRLKLQHLKNRVDAIEDASRRLSEISGVTQDEATNDLRGTGGPSIALDEAGIIALEERARLLEANLHAFEAALNSARVPSIWPIQGGEVTDTFGGRRDPFGGGSEFHSGQDIRAPKGTHVYAAANGVLTLAGWQSGYGNTVVVDHGNGMTTLYGHLSKFEATLGQEVKRGDLVGEVGSTGRSTGPHLHYEVRINEVAVDPGHYLPPQ